MRDLLELVAQRCGFAFELRDDARIHHLTALALHRATTFCQHLHESASSTAQVFDPHKFVIDGAVSARREIGFVRHDRRVERRQPCAKFVLGLFSSCFLLGECLQAGLHSPNLTAGYVQAKRAQFGDECTVATRGISLTLEWLQLPTHFAKQVLSAKQVGFGALESAFCFFFALAVL